jgi:hypothetical protein
MIELVCQDFLRQSGWLESIEYRKPQRDGSPIPWFTYAAIDFVDQMEISNKFVLEIGGGFSTLYWARRGASGVTFEDDLSWKETLTSALVSEHLQDNFKVLSFSRSTKLVDFEMSSLISPQILSAIKSCYQNDLSEENLESVLQHVELVRGLTEYLPLAGVVVVDGAMRNLCLLLADTYCRTGATIILDNSERPEYSSAYYQLIQSGWKVTDFVGLGPINPYQWTTSIFQR